LLYVSVASQTVSVLNPYDLLASHTPASIADHAMVSVKTGPVVVLSVYVMVGAVVSYITEIVDPLPCVDVAVKTLFPDTSGVAIAKMPDPLTSHVAITTHDAFLIEISCPDVPVPLMVMLDPVAIAPDVGDVIVGTHRVAHATVRGLGVILP
jgi:hypothetical protein